MARTAVTAQTPPLASGASYTPAIPLAANSADLAWTAADTVNNMVIAPLVAGKTLVLARNTGASAHTVTFTSVADPFGRTGDITAYSLAAGEVACFGPFGKTGWDQASAAGLYFTANHLEIEFACLQLP